MKNNPDDENDLMNELSYIYKFVRNSAWVAFVVLAIWFAYFRNAEASLWPIHAPVEIHIPTSEDMLREEQERQDKQDEFERFQERERAKERQEKERQEKEEKEKKEQEQKLKDLQQKYKDIN